MAGCLEHSGTNLRLDVQNGNSVHYLKDRTAATVRLY